MQVYQLAKHLFSWWDKHSENLYPCDSQHLLALIIHKENSDLVGRKFLPDFSLYKNLIYCFIVGKHFHNACSSV